MRSLLPLAGAVALAGALGASALPSAAGPSFASARSYGTGAAPNLVAVGDLNGDAKADLAIANGGIDAAMGAVSVHFNRGDGAFPSRRDFATGRNPESVAIGDLNGDGSPDLATANGDVSTLSVLLNRGGGRFQARRDYPSGSEPFSVAVGDLNGDGYPDLATANGGASTASVFLNNGDGSFRARVDYRTGHGPQSIAIADLNGDGAPDIVTANGEDPAHSVSVLVNNGAGGFRAKADYPTGPGPVDVAIGDLNGDGKPDLATANFSANTASVLLNGDGSFRARVDYRTGHGPQSIAIGDLNGDGSPELAITNFDQLSAVSVLPNRGDGSFEPKIDFRTGRSPGSVAIGDLNGDGKQDLVTANFAANTVSVLLNTPGRCTVQNVRGRTLSVARRTIARAGCRIGQLRLDYSKFVRKGRVISQVPKFGTVLRGGGKVNLVVSRGRRHS